MLYALVLVLTLQAGERCIAAAEKIASIELDGLVCGEAMLLESFLDSEQLLVLILYCTKWRSWPGLVHVTGSFVGEDHVAITQFRRLDPGNEALLTDSSDLVRIFESLVHRAQVMLSEMQITCARNLFALPQVCPLRESADLVPTNVPTRYALLSHNDQDDVEVAALGCVNERIDGGCGPDTFTNWVWRRMLMTC